MRYAIDKYKRKKFGIQHMLTLRLFPCQNLRIGAQNIYPSLSFECISRCIRENVTNNRRTNSANNDMEIIFRILHQSIVAMKKLTIPSLPTFLSHKGSQ